MAVRPASPQQARDGRPRRIGGLFVQALSDPAEVRFWAAFLEGLREYGWVSDLLFPSGAGGGPCGRFKRIRKLRCAVGPALARAGTNERSPLDPSTSALPLAKRSTGCQLGRPGFLGPGELVRKPHALAVGAVESHYGLSLG
jgi:hypothetical protein